MNEYFFDKKDHILIYPKEPNSFVKKELDAGDKINKELFQHITQTINVIIIVPDEKYVTPSSVFTLAGYCIALKKRLFICYENRRELLPYILQMDCSELDVHTIEYNKIEQIPFLVDEKMGSVFQKVKKKKNEKKGENKDKPNAD